MENIEPKEEPKEESREQEVDILDLYKNYSFILSSFIKK